MRPRHTILATLLLVTWVTSHASAQQTAGSTAVTGETLAPVIIDGEQLFLVQGISAYPAERERIEDGQPSHPFLPKPFTRDQLLAKVAEAVQARAAEPA